LAFPYFQGGERLNPDHELDKVEVLLPQKHLAKRNSSDSLTTTDTVSTSAVDDVTSADNK
jgi:hypothetical protein